MLPRRPRTCLAAAGLAALLAGCGATATTTPAVALPPSGPPGIEITESPQEPADDGRPDFAWLFPADACPADVIGARDVKPRLRSEGCDIDLGRCVQRCKSDDANACYAAALRVQEIGTDERYSEALFLRACKLGVASGCTNRAAGMLNFDAASAQRDTCTARTFELTCDRHDPWGCTMFGRALESGVGVKKDLVRAAAVLPGGCSAGMTDPACQAAIQIMSRIKSEQGEPTVP